MQALAQKSKDHLKKFPRQFAQNLQCENSTGNYIIKSKNAKRCFDVKNLEDCSHCAQVIDGKDSYDVNYCEHFELTYDHIGFDDIYDVKFCNTCGFCKNCTHSAFCKSCMNLFGCIGLRDKKYCILNKQYSKEEYEKLVPKIIEHMQSTGEWGEYLPAALSPFCYNESVAQQFFPLSEDEIKKRGYAWKPRDHRDYQSQTYQIPDDIKEVSDDICQQILACTDCGKNYKIIEQELKFYRKMNLPIPRKCPDTRHLDRMALRTPRQLWNRKCDKCNADIKTAYSPDRPETVYCEKCYLKEVY
jgi:hypothetical protein